MADQFNKRPRSPEDRRPRTPVQGANAPSRAPSYPAGAQNSRMDPGRTAQSAPRAQNTRVSSGRPTDPAAQNARVSSGRPNGPAAQNTRINSGRPSQPSRERYTASGRPGVRPAQPVRGRPTAPGAQNTRINSGRSAASSGRAPDGARVRVARPESRQPSASRPTSLVARQSTDLMQTVYEKHLVRKQKRDEKFLQRVEKDEAVERERSAGVVRTRSGVDRVMLTIILTLLCLGTIMVFSASYPSALSKEGDSLYYIKRQAIFVAIGLTAMIIASAVNYKVYRKVAVPIYVIALGLLALVLVIGNSEGEAKRWIGIPNTPFSIQPSEVMKIALVLILAWYLEKHRKETLDRVNTGRMLVRGVIIPAALVGLACVLVLLEKHLSGTIIIGAIGITVMIIGGSHAGWTLGGTAAVAAAAIPAYLYLNPYAMQRITTLVAENPDLLKEKWQTNQGLYAIGSGGLFGVGLGASRQKYSYVSAAQNDFIFSIWCEEMGFIGALILVALYLLFIWRGYNIAMHAPDTFSALTAYGITTKVGLQAFLNIAVVCDIIPNTGVSLPFFSYGGSSLVILMGEMGILLSISKHSYQRR